MELQKKESFGKFIARKRKEESLTQKELAELLYVTESAVSKWERGVSYPDISLVAPLCEALHISEHELITATEDLQQRELEKQAAGFQKIRKIYSKTFYFAYGISLVACLIANLAVQHTVSWFFIVLTAEMVAFSLSSVPLLVKHHKVLWMTGSLFVSLCLLLLTCCLYTGGDWFLLTFTALLFGFGLFFVPGLLCAWQPKGFGQHKALISLAADTVFLLLLVGTGCLYAGRDASFCLTALQVVLFCALLPWALLAVIRYLPVNRFFKAAIGIGMTGSCVLVLNSMLHVILDGIAFRLPVFDFSRWTETTVNANVCWLIFFLCAGLAVVFAVCGVIRMLRISSRGPEREQDSGGIR